MSTGETLRRINVLAVDDQPANLLALDAVLSEEDNVIPARSGPEAIEILRRRTDIDVILMDLQMPVMDGFEAAAKIKKLPGYEDVPIIFITAVYREEPFITRGYEVGAVDYFSKPFDPAMLRRKVAIYGSFRQKADVLRARELQIRETEDLLRAGRKLSGILEDVPVGVLVADVEGEICQSNEVASRICKVDAAIRRNAYGEVLGWWDANGRLIRDELSPVVRALRSGEVSHNELIDIRCLDGTEKGILVSASPLLGLDGEIVGAVVVIQDVTESKKITKDIERRLASLLSLGVELEQDSRLS